MFHWILIPERTTVTTDIKNHQLTCLTASPRLICAATSPDIWFPDEYNVTASWDTEENLLCFCFLLGCTKYSISAIMNSLQWSCHIQMISSSTHLTLRSPALGETSLRNVCPIWAAPNGRRPLLNSSSRLKLTKIPWDVSGRRNLTRR